MANQNAKIDENYRKTMLAITDDANQELRRLLVDATTGRLKCTATFSSGAFLNIDQTTPQTVINGIPTFNLGVNLGNLTSGRVPYATTNGLLTDSASLTFNSGTGTLSSTYFAGDGLALGSGNLTMTGSLAATGARITKGWFTDIESTNAPTVSGAAVYYSGGTDVAVADGGTGLSTIALGSVLVANVANTLAALTYTGGGAKVLSNTAGVISWEDAAAGDGASKALDNLASVAINTSLISDTDSTDDLGSSSKYWANAYIDKIYVNSTAAIDGATAGQLKITGALVPASSDGAALGTTSLLWSDLFLASGSVINFNNGDITLTHSENILTMAGGKLVLEDLDINTYDSGGIQLKATFPDYFNLYSAYTGATGDNRLVFYKSRGTLSSPSTISSGDSLGTILWAGYTAAGSYENAAYIQASVDGTPGSGDIPGRLTFWTTPDGSATPVERMRIDSAGNVLLGSGDKGFYNNTADASDNGTITIGAGGSRSDSRGAYIWLFGNEYTTDASKGELRLVAGLGDNSSNKGNITFWTGSSERMRIDNAGAITMLAVYSDTVGGTNRDLYIDNTGLIGYVSSSIRYKDNVMDLTDTERLYDLRPVSFTWKKDGIKSWGLIAEEADKVMPEIVSYNADGVVESVEYTRLIAPMLAEIQNLKKEVEKLKKK